MGGVLACCLIDFGLRCYIRRAFEDHRACQRGAPGEGRQRVAAQPLYEERVREGRGYCGLALGKWRQLRLERREAGPALAAHGFGVGRVRARIGRSSGPSRNIALEFCVVLGRSSAGEPASPRQQEEILGNLHELPRVWCGAVVQVRVLAPGRSPSHEHFELSVGRCVPVHEAVVPAHIVRPLPDGGCRVCGEGPGTEARADDCALHYWRRGRAEVGVEFERRVGDSPLLVLLECGVKGEWAGGGATNARGHDLFDAGPVPDGARQRHLASVRQLGQGPWAPEPAGVCDRTTGIGSLHAPALLTDVCLGPLAAMAFVLFDPLGVVSN